MSSENSHPFLEKKESQQHFKLWRRNNLRSTSIIRHPRDLRGLRVAASLHVPGQLLLDDCHGLRYLPDLLSHGVGQSAQVGILS